MISIRDLSTPPAAVYRNNAGDKARSAVGRRPAAGGPPTSVLVQDRTGQDRTGKGRTRQGRAEDRTGQDKTGQGRAEQDREGQRTGRDREGQEGTGQGRAEQDGGTVIVWTAGRLDMTGEK